MSKREAIEQLKTAVRLSPENVPLRVLLADALFEYGLFEDAEAEYENVLVYEPNNAKARLSLARACFQSGKYYKALVLTEDLLKTEEAPGGAWTLHARLLLNEGDVQKAVEQYKKGVAKDPAVADPNFAERLGIGMKNSPVVDGKLRHSTIERTNDSSIVETARTKFADVGGMEDIKEQIRMKIIYPYTHPETFRVYDKKVGGGILMYGPPGCGKTFLARATAGEINAKFISVGLHQVLDMWIGSSERNLHEVFEAARASKPCLLFFDEVDALAASRSDMRQTGGRHIINQFLSELDGVDSDNDGVVIMAATNAPWYLDAAFRRPGRFDRIIFVPPPDLEARASIFRLMLRSKPIENIDFELLASKSDKFSGADLMALVDEAVERKIAEAMKDGIPKPLTTKDLQNAAKNVKPSTAEWFHIAKNYATYSNADGIYDDIINYLKLK